MDEKEWLGKENQLGQDIWTRKYCYAKESFEEWLERISGGNENVKKLIREKKFLFGGRILANRGLAKDGLKVTYSNCYVITPPKDSLESIFECAGKMARTFSYGGGCGIDISSLAPSGAKVNNTAKRTSGATSFMDLYSLVTGLIGQNGRRGALMISISCEHPDVEEFIKIKTDLKRVTKANISVRITDRFMKAVRDREDFKLTFTRPETGEKIEKTIDAYALFSMIAQTNWDYAEPGCLFWDRISDWNLLSETPEFSYAGTNPCAEEPLPAGGSCLLGSMNLAAFVKNGLFDYDDFRNAVGDAIVGLNEVLDEGLPLHPLDEQRESVTDWRQVGLGIFGLADMLIAMGIRYGSDESIEVSGKVGRAMINAALQKSAMLAKDEGAFRKCNIKEIMSSAFFRENADEATADLVSKYGLRNSQLLTIAPTGTLSTMLGISGGIEPVFANYYERKTESLMGHDQYYKVYTPVVMEYMEKHGINDDSKLPEWFITAKDLNFHERINMQGEWQKHIDAAISSTVNVPENFTVDDTRQLYMYAWIKGLKGITIFREGCKRIGILTTDEKHEEAAKENGLEKPQELKRGYILGVNDNVIGKKRKLTTGCGSLHCTAFFEPVTGNLLETYLSKGSSGGCNNFMIGLSRMISIAARGGIPIDKIIDQLDSTGSCPSYAVRHATKGDTSKGACCPMAVGNALKEMYDEVQKEIGTGNVRTEEPAKEVPEEPKKKVSNPCPQCGSELVFEGGCNICKNCGWTKCD